jgi:hypothetical protein
MLFGFNYSPIPACLAELFNNVSAKDLMENGLQEKILAENRLQLIPVPEQDS